ncbi:MAG: carbonic anhydrase [Bacteroidia bacterium]|nr:carbonic anhydrase [Bacteroidia bacterium]
MVMNFEEIFQNNQNWIAEKLATDSEYFENLSKGQSPEILYIGCSDSRVTAEELMGADPGEVFVHRNIANLVVSTDNNLNAIVQYAVEYLKVKHIIVCGHYECGGIKAALEPEDMGQLNSWLQTLRDVYRLHRAELDIIEDNQKRLDKMAELNVLEQSFNIMKIDHVQRSWRKTGFPIIHGWIFDVRTGKLKDLNISTEYEYKELMDIYYLWV